MSLLSSRKVLATAVLCGSLFGAKVAMACSPNLPNYGNCIRMQQQQQQMIIQQGAMQQGYGYSGSRSSDDRYPVRTVTAEDIALSGDTVALYEARNPKQCTKLSNGMQRCWEGLYHNPPINHPATRPLIKLYTLDSEGRMHGWHLEYGKYRQLLWTNYWHHGNIHPTGSKEYNFYDAPEGKVNIAERLNDRETTGNRGWGKVITEPQAQGLRELGLKSMKLQDTMHPDDWKAMIRAEQHWKEVEKEYDRRWHK